MATEGPPGALAHEIVQVPETKYAQSGEIAIAFQVHGSGPNDIVFVGSTASNVETVWNMPEAHRLFEQLGRFARIIRLDRRDSGCSDAIKDDLTLEAHVADALAVMDAAGVESATLVGGLDGARTLAALAATQPARARGLIAISATRRGVAVEAPEITDQVVAELANLNWPGHLLDVWAPKWASDPVRRDRMTRYFQTCLTPRQAARLIRLSLTSDISDVLPLIQAPTLVLHPRDSFLPAEPVREFSSMVPDAEFREISGDAGGLLYALELSELAAIIEEFVTGAVPPPPTTRVLATVLFTDLVGSTQRAAELGDRAWTTLLESHHSTAKSAISDHGGDAIKTLGDGVLATFSGPAQAVRCARRLTAEARSDGLEIRAGVHTGELELAGEDVAGLAVHLGARIMGKAEPGEVLVSRTVRDLVVGSELEFEPRGEHELKGIPDAWALYALA